MTPSILAIESTSESVPKSSFHWVWLGFMFVVAFVVLETLMVLLELDQKTVKSGLTLIAIAGFIYWLVCIHRLHKILGELDRGYPITGAEAVGMHFIPLYNIYWVFNWPTLMVRYINGRGRVRMMPGYVSGLIILLAMLVRYLDGGLGLLLLFGITAYLSSKLKQHVRLVTAALPENLPPLPDPRMFSGSAETTANPMTR